jgi:hypothetical protein
MPDRPIDNERKACDAVARCLEALWNTKRVNERCPEKDGRGAPVDYVFDLADKTRALEHTIIEAFEGQIHTGVDFARFIAPIQDALDPSRRGQDPAAAISNFPRCSVQIAGVGRSRSKSVHLQVSFPSSSASTMSGASNVRRNTRQR